MQSKLFSIFSFENTLKNSGVPIITFTIGDKPYNFLMDTGSDGSYLDTTYFDWDSITPDAYRDRVLAHAGGVSTEKVPRTVQTLIDHDGKEYIEVFEPMNLGNVSDSMEEEGSVRIQGILGNSFFQRYAFTIDYSSMTAVNNKKIKLVKDEEDI